MKHICGECGAQIDEGMDFCPRCGCMKDKSYVVDDSGMTSRVCPQCGEPVGRIDEFCGKCGCKLNPQPVMPMPFPRMRKNGNLALILAILPGFFNIFGLGHLVMKKYSRGCMFLGISLILWYLNGWQLSSSNMTVMILDLLVFFYQSMDIFRVVYAPGDD